MTSKIIVIGGIMALVLMFRFAINNADLHNEPGDKAADDHSITFTNLSVKESLDLLKTNPETFLVDVHTPEQEHLAGTNAFIPFDKVTDRSNYFPEDKNTPILVYCRSGNMSLDASEDLIELGYTNVFNLSGGIHAWTGAGYPLDWNQDTK